MTDSEQYIEANSLFEMTDSHLFHNLGSKSEFFLFIEHLELLADKFIYMREKEISFGGKSGMLILGAYWALKGREESEFKRLVSKLGKVFGSGQYATSPGPEDEYYQAIKDFSRVLG